MAMSRKQKRGIMIGAVVAVLCASAILVMVALRETLVFFRTPSDVAALAIKPGERFRLGGLVAKGSVVRGDGLAVSFAVTDTDKTLKARYTGILPDLFAEGQGVVAEGRLDAGGVFVADTVLAKHDENYLPPEVAKSLKERGVFKDGAARPPTKTVAPVEPKPTAGARP
jgi:cytochrome c-type biogenesis protein CcmE